MLTEVVVNSTDGPITYNLDFTPLLTPGVKFAVSLNTRSEAGAIIAAMKKVFPEKISDSWDENRPTWRESYFRTEEGMVYFPDLNDVEGFNLQWCSVAYAKSHGYEIVDFDELLVQDSPLDDFSVEVGDLLGMIGVS